MIIRLPKDEDKHVSDTYDIARIMQKILFRNNKISRAKEYFWSIGFDKQNNIAYIELVTIGIANRNIIRPPQLFRMAIAKDCDEIVLCHNHPSGDPKPSKADIEFTNSMIKAGGLLDIVVREHIILGQDSFEVI
ncbi:hypothetical protein KIM67_00750 [Flagellimonas sp. 389]|uniref:JAB domain-containing protein n=1 Tax=Flagellimonas sp. 389 TaxID=2835862 RepID=UPI001BD62372|nr:JAB domain-containing protein [Flagellimonas sp. 389]MBS9460919.1 hypothetical protein [Flagellimonas sp. 389]